MKFLVTLLCLLFSINVFSQLRLTREEKDALILIVSTYNAGSPKGRAEGLREVQKTTPARFKHFVDHMIIVQEGTEKILDTDHLTVPSDEELEYWYVVREFHHNKSAPDSMRKTNEQIVDWLSQEKIDRRWLVDNYYYRAASGLGKLYNTVDLSNRNFDLETLGLRDDTEKATFLMFVVNECLLRLAVMRITGKGDPTSALRRLPKFNGQDYYFFQNFNYPDFDWIGYQKVESYNTRHIGRFYNTLLNHLELLMKAGEKSQAFTLYENSILSTPEFFHYYSNESSLQDLYAKWGARR
jgi:hypothetical protein